jgi:hypothetical protein
MIRRWASRKLDYAREKLADPGRCCCLFASRCPAIRSREPGANSRHPDQSRRCRQVRAGADTGDTPGEFQFWVEREHLDRVVPLPAGNRDLRINDKGVLGIVTGVGTAKAAASIMALGLDPRFDLRHSYWLVAGIAGGDPADASLGSAVWAEWVVDGDLGHELDAREIPADWTTGFVPLRKSIPFEKPLAPDEGQAYHLNPGLVDWAYQLTRDVPLADTDTIRERRMHFDQPAARRPPFVLKGDEISSSTFWHGRKMDEWANAWVSYYTGGAGNMVTTGMEDTGTLQSLTFGRAGRAWTCSGFWFFARGATTISIYRGPPSPRASRTSRSANTEPTCRRSKQPTPPDT